VRVLGVLAPSPALGAFSSGSHVLRELASIHQPHQVMQHTKRTVGIGLKILSLHRHYTGGEKKRQEERSSVQGVKGEEQGESHAALTRS
jgi:hypothetical protein